MAGKADYLENKLLNHVLGGVVYTPPASTYVALYTVTPSDAGGGTEVTGGSYAQVEMTNNSTSWPGASGGAKANGIAIEFPQASAAWGTAVAFSLLDSTGNFLYWGPLTVHKTIGTGDSAAFGIGDLDVTED